MMNNFDKYFIKNEDGEVVFSNNLPLLVSPSDIKTKEELEAVIAKGKSQDLIEYFVKGYLQGVERSWVEKEYNSVCDRLKAGEEYETVISQVQEYVPNQTTEDILISYSKEINKAKRGLLVSNLKVTTSTGKTFDADQLSILRLNTAVTKLMLEPDLQTIPWSTDDIPTGAMINCTRDEIFEAFKLATDQFTENWEFKE